MITAKMKWGVTPTKSESELTNPAMSGKKLTCAIHLPKAQPPMPPANPPTMSARGKLNRPCPGRDWRPPQIPSATPNGMPKQSM